MKKLYPGFVLGLLLLITLASRAQVSVTATQGTLTQSYTYLTAAFNAINAGTHKGQITITISANVADTGACVLGPNAAPAAYTSILIKPAAGTTPTISGTVGTALIALVGSTNVTIDGSNTTNGTTKDLTITNNSNTTVSGNPSNTIRLLSGASNNTIKNCVIKGASQSSGVIWFANSTAGSGNNNNLVQNNDITKSVSAPVAAVFTTGATGFANTGNIFRGNRITDFAAYGFLDGIPNSSTAGFSSNTTVDQNEFFQNTPQTTGMTAILIANPTGISNMNITRNRIYNLLSSTTTGTIVGIDLYDAVSVNVNNNFIALSSATSPNMRGIAQETGAGAIVKVFHNTVFMYGAASDTSVSFAYLKNYTSTGDSVRNNILVNKRTSLNGKQYVIANVNTGTMNSNYNDLFASGNANNIIGRISTSSASTDYPTLANWQTGASQDANSVSIDPVFVSNTDLHLSTSANATLDNKGIGLFAIQTDIDGNTRSATTPDLGADEFTAVVTCVAPAITTQPTAQTVCGGTVLNLSVTATGSTLQYQWRKGGSNISGATNATYTVASATANEVGNYDVVISNACGSVTSNPVAVAVNPRPTAAYTVTQAQCVNQQYTYTNSSTISAGTIASYEWSFGNGGVSIAASPSYAYPAAGTFNARLIATSALGCKDTVTKAITVSNCTAIPSVDANISSVKLMPNVVDDATTLRVIAGRSAAITFNIVDAQGKVVMTLNKQVVAGQNDIRLFVGQLSSGMYTITGETNKGRTETLRMVKN